VHENLGALIAIRALVAADVSYSVDLQKCAAALAPLTSRQGHAIEIARSAVKANRPAVVAVGGDGLLHEVVNGFFEHGRPIPTRSSLGLIPFGTGNDTRRTFGIPLRLAGAEL